MTTLVKLKLNGWHRLGIVASVVWMIWSYNHTFDRYYDQRVSIVVDQEMSCEADHLAAGEKFDDFFPKCDALSAANRPMRNQEYQDARVDAAVEALIPIPLAWGSAYIFLFLVGWVGRGFKFSSRQPVQ